MQRVRATRWRSVARPAALAVQIGVVALLARLLFVVLAPYDSGDWVLYRNVASNILAGCGVSVSIPGVGTCLPHFGGNQLPLYPAFAAANWWLFGRSETAILLSQSLCAAVAIAYVAWALHRASDSRVVMVSGGLLLAISPVQTYWAGSLLTETLAIAASTWVLAELLRSYAEERFRTLPIAAAMVVAVWTRMDSILLLLPCAWTAAAVEHGRIHALRRWAMMTMIVAATCLAWSTRNIAVGLPPLPRPWVSVSGAYNPGGFFHWVTSWVVGQKERGDALFFSIRDRDHFRLPDSAYASPAERKAVETLIARTRLSPGGPTDVPGDIDSAFYRLGDERRTARSPVEHVTLALKRFWALTGRWLWPWAGDIGDGRTKPSPTDYYRFTIVLSFAATALAGLGARDRLICFLAMLGLLYALLRSTFFALSGNIELRYLVELAPFLEVVAGLGLARLIEKMRPPQR